MNASCDSWTIQDRVSKGITHLYASWRENGTCQLTYSQTERFVVRRSVWPLDFASASRTTIHRSARVSHTMSAAARHRVTMRSSNHNRTITNRTKGEITLKNQSRATTCRHTRSLLGTRWAPPRVRANLLIKITH